MFFLVLTFLSITAYLLLTSTASAVESFCPGGSNPDPNVIWCDDFDDSISPGQKYWSYYDGGGSFKLVNGVGWNGSAGMQVVWQQGVVEAGNFKLLFGRNPFASGIYPNVDFKEIYWRIYVKMKQGWTGNPYKFSRATIMANQNWAQAMIAHIWNGLGDALAMDPASGIDSNGNLVTTTYNDFPNLHWLGNISGSTPIFSSAVSGQWFCVEAHAKLNTPGFSDGVFEFWVNGNQEASSSNLNWVGTWQQYGINGIFIENYWNGGSPGERTRYYDNFVVSKTRIGCNPAGVGDTTPPTVTSTNPANGATGVSVSTPITVIFSEAVDPLSVTTTTFLVKQGSTSIPGTVTLNGTTATFNPSAPLASNTLSTATITTGTKDMAGNAMASNYTWNFTTQSTPDTTPPTVTSTNPANGATGISVSTPITVTFSEAIDPTTIVPSALILAGGGGIVPCTASYSSGQAAFTPTQNLSDNTTYTATVTMAVKDLAGNAMASNCTWNFTTAQVSSGGGGGGGGCSLSPMGIPDDQSPMGVILALLSPIFVLVIRKTLRRR